MLAGVNGTDPFRLMDRFLDELKAMGFAGVQNFPTVGLIDGVFRQNLEETGMGYDLEVEMIRLAAERDLLTAPYVFDVESTVAMTRGRRRRARPAHGADHQPAPSARIPRSRWRTAWAGCRRCATRPSR